MDRAYRLCRSCIALGVILIAAGAPARSESSPTLLKPVPINVAEAIIEPFWTPELSGFAK